MKLRVIGGSTVSQGVCFLFQLTNGHNVVVNCGSSFDVQKGVVDTLKGEEGVSLAMIGNAHPSCIGSLPGLVQSNPKIQVLMTRPTAELAQAMLLSPDADEAIPRYVPEMVRSTFSRVTVVDTNRTSSFFEGAFWVRFHQGGSIPGASAIEMNCEGRRLFIPGEAVLEPSRILPALRVDGIRAEWMMVNARLGDTVAPLRKEQETGFMEAVENGLEKGGSVLVPCSTMDELPELLMILLALKKRYSRTAEASVLVDGVSAEFLALISRHSLLNYQKEKGLVIGIPEQDRDRFLKRKSQVVLVASGSIHAGACAEALRAMATNPRNTLLLNRLAEGEVPTSETERKRGEVVILRDGSGLTLGCSVNYYALAGQMDLVQQLAVVKKLDPKGVVVYQRPENLSPVFQEMLAGRHVVLAEDGKVVDFSLVGRGPTEVHRLTKVEERTEEVPNFVNTFEELRARVPALQDKLGVRFHSAKMLFPALIHPGMINRIKAGAVPERYIESSIPNVFNFERLEFMGDAAIGLSVREILYKRLPKHREGVLSELESWIVSRQALGKVANGLSLLNYVWLNTDAQNACVSYENSKFEIQGNVLEAIFGAVYLDRGLEAVQVLVDRLLVPTTTELVAEIGKTDPKSRLYMLCSKRLGVAPELRREVNNGEYLITVVVHGKKVAEATGKKMQDAEQAACLAALDIWFDIESG